MRDLILVCFKSALEEMRDLIHGFDFIMAGAGEFNRITKLDAGSQDRKHALGIGFILASILECDVGIIFLRRITKHTGRTKMQACRIYNLKFLYYHF